MHLTKNRFYQSIFYILIIFLIIFNGGNYDMYPQFNFVVLGSFFLFCFTDLNYKAHIKKFLFENKKIVLIYIVFLSYLIFQILPFQQELIKFLSPSKYKILLDLDYNNFSSISLDSSKTYLNFLNYISLICNPYFLFISNDSYKNSATGFFINRTVFSCFLNLCFLAGLEYLSLIDIIKYKKKDSYFTKIYLRIFLLFITIGIITSLSRIGNFLFLTVIILYLIILFFLKDKKNIFIFYSLILIIFFDILLFGIYFGGLEIINRFAFLKNELISYSNNNSLILTTNRGDLALFGLHQLKNFLFFGYGSGSFEILFKIFYLNTDIKYANHAHFDFIEFAGELGIIGVAILFFVVFNCCKKINFKNLKNFYLLTFHSTFI